MVIDLETEKANGLDELQLARDVMKLMGLSAECDGEPFDVPETVCWECPQCGRRFADWNPMLQAATHLRIPKPLCEVRDELIEWLRRLPIGTTGSIIRIEYNAHPAFRGVVTLGESGHRHKQVSVYFNAIQDEPLALVLAACRLHLGAVRLLGEKQDANTE